MRWLAVLFLLLSSFAWAQTDGEPTEPEISPLRLLGFLSQARIENPQAGATKFKPADERVAIVMLIESLEEEPPAQKELVAGFLEALKPVEALFKEIEAEHDVATAFAFFVASNYSTATGKDLDGPQMKAVIKQFQTGLGSKEMGELEDLDRQMLYETCLFHALLPLLLFGDQESASDEAKALANEQLKEAFRVDASGITVTEKGFVFAKPGE